MKILALIPARGGSKGIPRKNIKPLAGKPLVAWSIEEALKSRYIDKVVVSTDDEEIADVAHDWGASVPFIRPAELAQDSTPGADPALHALQKLPGHDVVLLLQPTSPLRTVEDIDSFIARGLSTDPVSMASVYPTPKNPYWMYTLGDNQQLEPIMGRLVMHRRQDMPPIYATNGALYWAKVNWLQENRNFVTHETVGFIMPAERSIDIDSPVDWALAEFLLNARPAACAA